MATPAPILIAGGGIGGLALALALAQTGRSSTVLEQREAFATAGAGIQLGPNGVRVLQRLGVARGAAAAGGRARGHPRARRQDGAHLGHAPARRLDRRAARRALLGGASRRSARRAARGGRGRARASRCAPASRWPRSRRPRRTCGPRALAGERHRGSRARRRRRSVVERATVRLPVDAAAVRRRHGHARRHSGCRGREAGGAGGRPVADAGRACRALPGARRRRDRRRRHRPGGLAGARLGGGGGQDGPARAAAAISTPA